MLQLFCFWFRHLFLRLIFVGPSWYFLSVLICHQKQTLSQTNKGTSIPLTTLVSQMYGDQGIAGFYRGVNVNVMRAIVLNATKMGVYDVAKGQVVTSTGWTRKDPRTAFCSSFLAGFLMTCTVAPFDRVRTKLMSQPTNEKIYTGLSDCLVKTVQQEGPLSLWRGFIPM